jgi:hypothetical protein
LDSPLHQVVWSLSLSAGPTSQDAKPRVSPGVHLPHLLFKMGGEPRVNPGVWRPEMWALVHQKTFKG